MFAVFSKHFLPLEHLSEISLLRKTCMKILESPVTSSKSGKLGKFFFCRSDCPLLPQIYSMHVINKKAINCLDISNLQIPDV